MQTNSKKKYAVSVLHIEQKIQIAFQAYTYISKKESSLPAIMSSFTDVFPFTTCSPLQVLQKFYKFIFWKQKKLSHQERKTSLRDKPHK